jgi:hypothetical protein
MGTSAVPVNLATPAQVWMVRSGYSEWKRLGATLTACVKIFWRHVTGETEEYQDNFVTTSKMSDSSTRRGLQQAAF